MEEKINCWEHMGCGRGPGGIHGECPVVACTDLNGVHSGRNAGRSCWVVAGTMCAGTPQGAFAVKYRDCTRCDFYRKVREEEPGMVPTIVLLAVAG